MAFRQRIESLKKEGARRTLRCTEVWGGHHPVRQSIALPGIDAWVVSQPSGGASTGGDIHQVSVCAGGHILRALVADVSGHGNSAASTAASLRRLMRDVISDHDQTRLVGELNRRFTFTALGTTAYRFATAVALTFNLDAAELLVCNAGHPPPLWFHAEEGSWTTLEGASDNSNYNLPVGIVEGISYEQFGVKVVPGDLILCYTDSLIEAASADGSAIGLAGLLKVVALIDQSRPAQFVPELLAAIDKFNPENLLRDDVTCLLMHLTNTVPKFPVLNRVFAPIRALAGSWGIPLPWLPRKPNGE